MGSAFYLWEYNIHMDFPIELAPEILRKAEKLEVKPQDIEEKWVTGGGKGGQKINKTASCVMLKHLPTGIMVKCQKHREQSKNRKSAYKLLILKIEEEVLGEESERAKKIFKLRKQKQKRSKRAKEKVLLEKAHRSEVKEGRKKISI